MTWLRAQGGPRPIVALTAGARADTSLLLKRPVSEKGLRDMLRKLTSVVPEESTEASPSERTAALPADIQPTALVPPPVAEPVVEEPVRPATRVLLDYLQPQALPGPARLRDAVPPLAINVAGGQYLGGVPLKPLSGHCSRAIKMDEWEPLSPAEFKTLEAELGEPQPLVRLLWLAGLNGYDGQLCPALADAERFKLAKWPPSEREYPRQIRIATALQKQFSTVDEFAASSGASAIEIADYINAFHAVGLIEVERAAGQAPAAPEPAARGGLLGRLRRG
jgi:hypothetical protein